MPRRKTTLSDSSPPASNQSDESRPDNVRTTDRPHKRRKTSVGSNSDHGSSDAANYTDMDKKPRQSWNSGNAQPTSKKASILSRAATTSSAPPQPSPPPTAAAAAPNSLTSPVTASGQIPTVGVTAPSQRQEVAAPDHAPVTGAETGQTAAVSVTQVIIGQQPPLVPRPMLLQQQAVSHLDEQRAQASSAPPALVSAPDTQDRRSTHSLEALFKVTDSELQNMRADTPLTSSPVHAPVSELTQNYIVLNGDGTQIIMTATTDTGGSYYTIIPSSSSTPSSAPQTTAFSFSGTQDMPREDLKLMFKNEVHSELLDSGGLSCAPQTFTSLLEQEDKDVSSTFVKTSASTPGRKRIHPQKPGKYKCKYCDRTCAKPSVLEKHLRAHTNERPFPCVVCGVSFKTKSNLSKHCKSNAHVSRTGLSWTGSKDNVSLELKDVDVKNTDEDNDSEGTETDVEGAGYVDNEDDSGEEGEKVVERAESLQIDIKPETRSELMVRQGNVLEGIRQKIDKNKRQQEQESKTDINQWFTRVFNAFDKPSESELTKYDDAETLVRQNILTVNNLKDSEEILSELNSLKTKYTQQYPATLPVLVTHTFQPDNKMLVKILKPKAEFLLAGTKPATGHGPLKLDNVVSCSGCIMSRAPSSTIQSTLGRPLSSTSILQSKLRSSLISDSGSSDGAAKFGLQSRSHSSDKCQPTGPALPRPKLVSHQSDNSSVRHSYSQGNKNNSLASAEEPSPTNRQRQTAAEGDVIKRHSTSSRHPALGESNTAAFSTIITQSDKPALVYQHALDSEPDKTFKSQGRTLSAPVNTDMLKDRIENIISSNAEIIDRHSVTEPPRQRNKYYRQASDSGFQTMKISDLKPANESAMDRLKVEAGDKQWKKKLAASLSVGDTDGARLKPDFVKRSMSTSALRKSDSSDGELRIVNLQANPNNVQPVSTSQLNELLLLQDTQQQLQEIQQQLQQQHQHTGSATLSHMLKITPDNLNERLMGQPVIVGSKHTVTDSTVLTQAVLQQPAASAAQLVSQQPAVMTDSLNSFTLARTDTVSQLEKSKSLFVPVPVLSRQISSGDSDLKIKPSADNTDSTVVNKPSSPNITGLYNLTPSEDGIAAVSHSSDMAKSFSVSSLSSGSPSGGRVTIQETPITLNPKLHPGISLSQSIPQTLPAKIVPGPGPHEIQIQFQLSSKGQTVPPPIHLPQAVTLPSNYSPVTANKNSSETSSIISSMLQAPRQLSPMIGQPGVQFPPRTKTASPLLTSKSLSSITGINKKVQTATLVQTGSLDSLGQTQDAEASGQPNTGLHEQKKLMSRQLPPPVSGKSSTSFMSELQQRLSVAQTDLTSSSSGQDWKKIDAGDQLAVKHFKSQGLSDGLAAAAGAYVMMGGMVTCDDCNESFNHVTLLNQHKSQHCPKTKHLPRSMSAIENASIKSEITVCSDIGLAVSDEITTNINSPAAKILNPSLLKSLSANDLQDGKQSNIIDMPKLREQLVSSSSTKATPPAHSSPAGTSYSGSDIKQQLQIQHQNLSIDSVNSSLPKKKGRPKGSKNRPKDLNLVLAKARGAHSQAILPVMRQTSSSMDSSAQKDSPLPVPGGQGQVLLVQSTPLQKILLPRSTSLAKPLSTEVPAGTTLAAPAGCQLLNTTPANTLSNISLESNAIIAQPMVPVISGSKILSHNSPLAVSSKTSFITATSKPGPGIPLITGVSVPGLAITCTSSMSIITTGTPITALAPTLSGLSSGSSKPGSIMISFAALTPSTPGTPLTPVTPTNPLAGKVIRNQGLEPTAPGLSKVSSAGLTLNISSAQSASSAQFSQMSPRVIPYIPAVTFHSLDTKQGSGGLPTSSHLTDQKPQTFRLSQAMPYTLTGTCTPGTPLTPATPDTPTDLSGTRRKLKDKLLLRQSLSVEKGQEKSLSVDSPAVLMKSSTDSPAVATSTSSHPLFFYTPTSKPTLQTSNSVLLASLTKPVITSQKLGSQPNAVITSAVMGKFKEEDKTPEAFYRSESETLANQESSKPHPPVMRAFSEPAAAKRFKKSKQVKPSPLSIEDKTVSPCGSSAGKTDELSSRRSWKHHKHTESGGSDSLDSGLSLRSVSQDLPFFLPKSSSIASLDSNELMIDLSGDNFNNVTIPINYSIPFVHVTRLQSSPLFTEWNNPNRATGLQVNLSPLTLAGSKIILPAIGGLASLQKESKNWLLKRSISLHQHFQIISRLWKPLSPVTLDSMTAMALAQGNPSPALLGRMLQSHAQSLSEAPNIVTTAGADVTKIKVSLPILLSTDHFKEESLKVHTASDLVTADKSDPHLMDIKTSGSTTILKSKLMSSPIKGNSDSQSTDGSSNFQSRQNLTPVKSAAAALGISISSPSLLLSSVEQHISNVTPSGTLHTPMYGHSCPTLYTTTHVTFCCIQKPQPMYVAVKGSKRVSMYSNWRLATHNPNPAGLTSRMLLALYKSRSANNPVYAQCSMTPNNGGNQTHSSYWTYQKKKMGVAKKEMLEHIKSEDGKKVDLVSTKEAKRHKLRLSKGGIKSNESYEYIRGRGWGKYICEICGIRCKKPSMLKKHLRTHTDVRPYHCRHCHFSFKTKGNLTKHMKSKSHSKKCSELGIVPVPTSVDDSQIDSVALEEQCRISREARIHDSTDGQNASGDEEDDEDAEGDEDDDEEDEDEEGMSREDTEDHSFDQERSGSGSPRVLKRQSSVDEASPAFSFTPGQRSRMSWGQGSSKSKFREFSESSSFHSSIDNQVSPHNIDTEIARSLLDLSQPRRSESKEIVDEEARRHALSHLQTLIAQLMSQKKPLSGLNLGTESLSPAPESGRLLISLSHCDEPQRSKSLPVCTESSCGSDHDDGQLKKFNLHAARAGQGLSTSSSEDKYETRGPASGELFISTDDKNNKSSKASDGPFSDYLQASPTSTSIPTRPNQLSLLKSPLSPLRLQHSNLPSPSLVSFLPAYAQKGRTAHTTDQGPIIGQFVRKDHHAVNTSNVALTPNLVLAGQSQPFHFNIPFPGSGSFSDSDNICTPSPSVNSGKPFTHTIPIVTITDTTCETHSPTVESKMVCGAEHGQQKSAAVTSLVMGSTPVKKSSHSLEAGAAGSSASEMAAGKSSIRPMLEAAGRSNSDSATTSPSLRDGAIESLIRKTSMPILLVTGTEYSKEESQTTGRVKTLSLPHHSEALNTVYSVAKRSRRLSSGKSRCLRRQRSLADDTAFQAMEQDSVFESPRSTTEISSTVLDVKEERVDDKLPDGQVQKMLPAVMTNEKIENSGNVQTTGSVNKTITQSADMKEEEILKVSPSVVQISDEKSKRYSCSFCSEIFDSSEAFNVHLRSRKHIGILESNGMLPSGTYEKLQQSEKRVQEENIVFSNTQTPSDCKISADDNLRSVLQDPNPQKVTAAQTVSTLHYKIPDLTTVESKSETGRVLLSDIPLLRRAYSLQEDTLPSAESSGLTFAQSRGQRPLYKRKISHTPVTESATVLITPHLNESLRQSLVKRARYGLTTAKDKEYEGLSGTDEQSVSVAAHSDSQSRACQPQASLTGLAPSPGADCETDVAPDSSSALTANPAFSDVPPVTAASPTQGAQVPSVPHVTTATSIALTSPRSMDGSKQYKCALCDLSFPSTQQLKNHLVSHAELRPYVCEFCDAGFTNNQSLRTHLLTHGQDRPYICGNCGDTFAQQADLQVHFSSHSSTSIRQHQNIPQDIKLHTTVQSVSLSANVDTAFGPVKTTTSHQSNVNPPTSNTNNSLSPSSRGLSMSPSNRDICTSPSYTGMTMSPSRKGANTCDAVQNMKQSLPPDSGSQTMHRFPSLHELSPKRGNGDDSDKTVNDRIQMSPHPDPTGTSPPQGEPGTRSHPLETMLTDVKGTYVSDVASRSFPSVKGFSFNEPTTSGEGIISATPMVTDPGSFSQLPHESCQQQFSPLQNSQMLEVQQLSQSSHQYHTVQPDQHHGQQYSQQVMFHQPQSVEQHSQHLGVQHQFGEHQQIPAQHSQFMMLPGSPMEASNNLHLVTEGVSSSVNTSSSSVSHMEPQNIQAYWSQDPGLLTVNVNSGQGMGPERILDLISDVGRTVEILGTQHAYPYPADSGHDSRVIQENMECQSQYDNENNEMYGDLNTEQNQNLESEALLLPQTYFELS
ncbi:hypothetical protein Btru_009701 [Bulinus truncatus]|nr:hypothetical protein Btru_009701 [Bulinus truncatus]